MSGAEDRELQSMGDTFAALFVDTLCVVCASPLRTLPANPTPTCDECIAKAAARERVRLAVANFAKTVPVRYAWTDVDAAELTARVTPATAIPWARGHVHDAWMTFRGRSGAGKTSLAVALVRERLRVTGEAGIMVLAFRLANARIQHRAGDGEPLIVERALRAPFLLLDDIGQEAMTPHNPIADIVQERDAEQLPTWITTGLTREEVGQRYGGGVARRVFETARVVPLGMPEGARAAPPRVAPEAYDPAARRAGDS